MKKLIPFFLVLASIILLESCASQKDFSSSSVFQKRKHLKGYHLNIKRPEIAKREHRPAKKKNLDIQVNTSITHPTVIFFNDSLPTGNPSKEVKPEVILQKERQYRELQTAEATASRTSALPPLSFKSNSNSISLLQMAKDETKKEKIGLGKLSFFMHLASLLLNVLLVIWLVFVFLNRFDFWLGIELSIMEIAAFVSIGMISTLLSLSSLILAFVAVIQYSKSEKDSNDKKDLTFALIRLGFFLLSILAYLFTPIVLSLL